MDESYQALSKLSNLCNLQYLTLCNSFMIQTTVILSFLNCSLISTRDYTTNWNILTLESQMSTAR